MFLINQTIIKDTWDALLWNVGFLQNVYLGAYFWRFYFETQNTKRMVFFGDGRLNPPGQKKNMFETETNSEFAPEKEIWKSSKSHHFSSVFAASFWGRTTKSDGVLDNVSFGFNRNFR